MLSDPVLEKLRPLVMTLRIIVIALSLGIFSFGVIAAVQNADKPLTFGTKVNYLFLAVSAPMFVAGFVVPRFFPKYMSVQAQGFSDPNEPEKLQSAYGVFAALQTATIVGCSVFEGAAFTNLVAYMQDAELVHAAVAGVALLCVLAHFPITGRIVQRIEDQLQRRRDEQQFNS